MNDNKVMRNGRRNKVAVLKAAEASVVHSYLKMDLEYF